MLWKDSHRQSSESQTLVSEECSRRPNYDVDKTDRKKDQLRHMQEIQGGRRRPNQNKTNEEPP